MKILLMRQQRVVNTDPQRRCYDGCHFSSELIWTEWEELERAPTQEKADGRIKFWTELNDYAVSARGEEARREFKLTPETEELK